MMAFWTRSRLGFRECGFGVVRRIDIGYPDLEL
jgi:hypothetical protein